MYVKSNSAKNVFLKCQNLLKPATKVRTSNNAFGIEV